MCWRGGWWRWPGREVVHDGCIAGEGRGQAEDVQPFEAEGRHDPGQVGGDHGEVLYCGSTDEVKWRVVPALSKWPAKTVDWMEEKMVNRRLEEMQGKGRI